MGKAEETTATSRSFCVDPALFRKFKVKATEQGIGVNQYLNDVIADAVKMPRRKVFTSRKGGAKATA